MTWVMLLSVTVVLMHCLRQIATMSHLKWRGHQIQFAGLALAHALIAGGAAGIALGLGVAPLLLLVGVAGKILFDRRGRRGA